MNAEQRKQIIREIEGWRRNRLLPEHYCDFLLNLYLEDHGDRKSTVGSVNAIRNSNAKPWLAIISLIGIISLFVLNFNYFSLPMQIGVTLLIVALCYMVGISQRNRIPIASYCAFGAGSVVLLYVGIYLLDVNNAGVGARIALIASCAIVWMITGIAARLSVLHFCGWIVLLLVYAWLLHYNLDNLDWIGLQMGWVPVTIVLGWLGWLFHHSNKRIGSVLLCVGVIAWFVPEGYGWVWTSVAHGVLQLSMLAKLAIMGGVLFAARKTWTEWVA